MSYVAGKTAGLMLCEAFGIDPTNVQCLWVECEVCEPVRLLVQYLPSTLDFDRLIDALKKIDPQDFRILEKNTMSEVDRYWNQIPEHVRDVIVKRIVADWLKHEKSEDFRPNLSAESASVPVPPAAIAGHDEDDAA